MTESSVPFGSTIQVWQNVTHGNWQAFVEASRVYEGAYLAWEMVRTTRNPFFTKGTGFEGYFVGWCSCAEALLEKLLAIGHTMLENNRRLYRRNYALRRRLMATLRGESSDPEAIAAWADEFGATLAQLRGNVVHHPEAAWFQDGTYRLASLFPEIDYERDDQGPTQRYAIGVERRYTPGGLPRVHIGPEMLKPRDQEAGLVMWNVGVFGHPLVRQYLRERSHWLR